MHKQPKLSSFSSLPHYCPPKQVPKRQKKCTNSRNWINFILHPIIVPLDPPKINKAWIFRKMLIFCFVVDIELSLLLGGASSNAQWRKPLRNLELRILLKWGPWLPFSQVSIISDRNIWMLSPLQFHFQFEFGYELKTVFCSSWIPRESVAIERSCGKDVNQNEGTSWPEPLENESKYFCFDPGYENIWKIFAYFKCKIHNEGLPGQFFSFLVFFSTLHELYMV